jgi:hypothetical protein
MPQRENQFAPDFQNLNEPTRIHGRRLAERPYVLINHISFHGFQLVYQFSVI